MNSSSQNACDLTQGHCLPCEGGVEPLSSDIIEQHLSQLNNDWACSKDNKVIHRNLTFKDFKATMLFVNQLADMAEAEGHHPDLELGYGYCNIRFTTHAIDGLSLNDFICAAKLDGLIKSG